MPAIRKAEADGCSGAYPVLLAGLGVGVRIHGEGNRARRVWLMRPDWKAAQRDLMESLCVDVSKDVWVAEFDGAVAGFVVTQADDDTKIGRYT